MWHKSTSITLIVSVNFKEDVYPRGVSSRRKEPISAETTGWLHGGWLLSEGHVVVAYVLLCPKICDKQLKGRKARLKFGSWFLSISVLHSQEGLIDSSAGGSGVCIEVEPAFIPSA